VTLAPPANINKKLVMTPLTDQELDAVTIVFHQYETGLREGTIYTKDLLDAMKALGLSPTEQEVVDMQCEVEKKGRIFFPDFCKLCLRKFREFDEENFRQIMFKNICGTEPHPVKFRAKKYKIAEKSFGLSDFRQMMSHLPEHVPDTEILEMFKYADKDRDGRISYDEFLIMITPVKVPETPIICIRPESNNEDININDSNKNQDVGTAHVDTDVETVHQVDENPKAASVKDINETVSENGSAANNDVPVATLVTTA